jgi:hypothetical protein
MGLRRRADQGEDPGGSGGRASSALGTDGSPSNTPLLSFTLRDLLRNPRRTLASVTGVALTVGLFSGIVSFVDSSVARNMILNSLSGTEYHQLAPFATGVAARNLVVRSTAQKLSWWIRSLACSVAAMQKLRSARLGS